MGIFGIMRVRVFWILRILDPWDFGDSWIVGFQDSRILGVWDFETLGFGDVVFSGSLDFGILGLLGSQDFRIFVFRAF